MGRAVGLVDPGLEVQVGDAHVGFRRHFHGPELRLVVPAALAHRPGAVGRRILDEPRRTDGAVQRFGPDGAHLHAAVRPRRQERIGFGEQPLGQHAHARLHGGKRQSRTVPVVVPHAQAAEAAGKRRDVVGPVGVRIGNLQGHRNARARIRRQHPVGQFRLRQPADVPPEGRVFAPAVADAFGIVAHAGLAADGHDGSVGLDAAGIIDVALDAQFIAGLRDLAVGHLEFERPAEQLDVVHAERAVGIARGPAVARPQHEAQIDAGNARRNRIGQFQIARPPLPAAQVGQCPRRPGRIGGEGALFAGGGPLGPDIGEAVGSARLRPREDNVLGRHQRQLELDPRDVGRAEVPMGSADVAHVQFALVGLSIAVEHVVLAGAAGVDGDHLVRVGRRPGNGGIGQQAAAPGARRLLDGQIGETPRREDHLMFAGLLGQIRIGLSGADLQRAVGAHGRQVRIVVVNAERDEPAQTDQSVVHPGSRQEVGIAFRGIAVPRPVIPVIRGDDPRIGHGHFGVLHAAHDVFFAAAAVRGDAAGVDPMLRISHVEQADHVVAADLQHQIGGDQIRHGVGNQRVRHDRQVVFIVLRLAVENQQCFAVRQPVVRSRQMARPDPAVQRVVVVMVRIHLYHEHVLVQVDVAAGAVVELDVFVLVVPFAELAEEQIAGAGLLRQDNGVGFLAAGGDRPDAGGIDRQIDLVGRQAFGDDVGEDLLAAGQGVREPRENHGVVQPVRGFQIQQGEPGFRNAPAVVHRKRHRVAVGGFDQLAVADHVGMLFQPVVVHARIGEVEHFVPGGAHADFVEIHVIERRSALGGYAGRQPDAGDGADADGVVAVDRDRRGVGIDFGDVAAVAVERPHPDGVVRRLPFAHDHIVRIMIGRDAIGIARRIGGRGRERRVRLVDSGEVAGARRLAEEDFLGFATRSAHQRQADEFVRAVQIGGLVVHHEGHERAAVARGRQGAEDLSGHRRILLIHPLQFVGVGRRIADGPGQQVRVVDVEQAQIVAEPGAVPALPRGQAFLLGQREGVGVGKLVHDFPAFVVQGFHRVGRRLRIGRRIGRPRRSVESEIVGGMHGHHHLQSSRGSAVGHRGIADRIARGIVRALDRHAGDRVGGPQQQHGRRFVQIPAHHHHFRAVRPGQEVGGNRHVLGDAERVLIGGLRPIVGPVGVVVGADDFQQELAVDPVEQVAGDRGGETGGHIADAGAVRGRIHGEGAVGNGRGIAVQRPRVAGGEDAALGIHHQAGHDEAARQELVGREQPFVHVEPAVFGSFRVFVHHIDGHGLVGRGSQG